MHNSLEKIVEKLQSELYVTKNVNTLLSSEINDLQQYQRRHCIVINGLCTSPNETSNQVIEKVEEVLTEKLQFDPEEVNYQLTNVTELDQSTPKMVHNQQ